MDALDRFSAIFVKGDNFLWLIYFPVHQFPSEGVSSLKEKHLLPNGSKSFPFREDPFGEGSKTILAELSLLKVYQFLLHQNQIMNTLIWQDILLCI